MHFIVSEDTRGKPEIYDVTMMKSPIIFLKGNKLYSDVRGLIDINYYLVDGLKFCGKSRCLSNLKTTTSSKNWNRPKTNNSANSGQKEKQKKNIFLLANFSTVIQLLLNSYISITQSLRTGIPLCQVHSCSDLLGAIFLPTSLYLEHLHN